MALTRCDWCPQNWAVATGTAPHDDRGTDGANVSPGGPGTAGPPEAEEVRQESSPTLCGECGPEAPQSQMAGLWECGAVSAILRQLARGSVLWQAQEGTRPSHPSAMGATVTSLLPDPDQDSTQDGALSSILTWTDGQD